MIARGSLYHHRLSIGAPLAGLLVAGWVRSGNEQLLLVLLAAPVFAFALFRFFSEPEFAGFCNVEGTSRQLAWIRILACLSGFLLTICENLRGISEFPFGFASRDGLFGFLATLPTYRALLSDGRLLAALQWATTVLLVFAMVGFKTRLTLPLAALGYFIVQGILRQYTYFFHSGLLTLYLLLLLPWTPCADAWSIDNLLRRRRAGVEESSRRFLLFSVFACFAVPAATYFFCGASKLANGGLEWFRPELIQHKFVRDAVNPIFLDYPWKLSIWLLQQDAPAVLYTALGAAVLAGEIAYPAVLFSRTARGLIPPFMILAHLGIVVFHHILFLDCILLQLMFWDVDRLKSGFKKETAAAPVSLKARDRQRKPGAMEFGHAWLCTLSVAATALMVVWVFRIESYPVSGWQMYSDVWPAEPVLHVRMVAALEDGTSIIVPRRDYSPAEDCEITAAAAHVPRCCTLPPLRSR